MKYFLVLIMVAAIAGCQNDNSNIYGSWKSPPDEVGSLSLFYDSMVFLRPDSLKSFVFRNGEILRTTAGTFQADEKQKKLTIITNDSTYQFDILTLTNDSLQFRNIRDTLINTYLRVK